MSLGQNFTILDGKLRIETAEWIKPIKEHYPALEEQYNALEPHSVAPTQALLALRSNWQAR